MKVTKPFGKTEYLRELFVGQSIAVGATDGTKTIAQATDVFTGYIDPYFVVWGCDAPGQPMEPTKAQVFEQTKDGTFAEIFGGFGRGLESLRWEQSQIVDFAVKNRDKLRGEGYGNFFLFKVGDEFFVATVGVFSSGRLLVDVLHFSDVYVWPAESRHRFVVPQRAIDPLVCDP